MVYKVKSLPLYRNVVQFHVSDGISSGRAGLAGKMLGDAVDVLLAVVFNSVAKSGLDVGYAYLLQ